MSTDALVALDVGGTSIRGELLRPVRDAGEVVDLEVLERVLADTPRAGAEPDGGAILDAIERVCKALLDSATSHRASVSAVGVAVPGVVDTAMQATIRSEGAAGMPREEYERFVAYHRHGELLPPAVPGCALAVLAFYAPPSWSGAFLSWDEGQVQSLVRRYACSAR